MKLLELIGIGSEIVKARADLKVAKVIAQKEVILSGNDASAAWEGAAAQNAQSSLADEYWTGVISIPLISAFIPPFVPFVEGGFAVLETVPEWYKWAVGASISFAFARRGMPLVASKFVGKAK